MRLAARAVRLTLAAFALLLFGLTMASAAPLAATTAVSIQGFAFGPANVTITVGDSVKWTNLDGAPHSAVAQGSFNTGTLGQDQSATVTFNTAGSFAYICGIHGSSMSGSVTVRAPATPAPTTAAPTPVPTPVPTAQPTVAPTPRPTLAPTPQPTVAPTPQPTIAPTLPPTVAPTPEATIARTPTATAAPATSAPVAVTSPAATAIVTSAADATLATNESGPDPIIVAGAAVIVVGLGGLAWLALRR